MARRVVRARRYVNSSADRWRLRRSGATTPRRAGRGRCHGSRPSPYQSPHRKASRSHSPNPSTLSRIWLWKESRRSSPSVMISQPACSWRVTTWSIARSSAALSSADPIVPSEKAFLACNNSRGRSRLPTWSVWMLLIRLLPKPRSAPHPSRVARGLWAYRQGGTFTTQKDTDEGCELLRKMKVKYNIRVEGDSAGSADQSAKHHDSSPSGGQQ